MKTKPVDDPERRVQRCLLSSVPRTGPNQLILCILSFLVLVRSEATLIRFKFSKPIVIGDVVICVEIGSGRAVSVSAKGKTLWRKTTRRLFSLSGSPFVLTEGPGGGLLFQRDQDNRVFRMEPRSGRVSAAFSLASTNDVIFYDASSVTLFAKAKYAETKTKVLDSQTGRVIWETDELNQFVGSHEPELFILSGPSLGEGFGRKLTSNEIQSIAKTTGAITWKRSVPVSCNEAVLIWPYLVLEDENKITVLAAETGALVREFDVKDWVIQIMPFESQLVYSTSISKPNLYDEDMVLHFCSLPELKEQKELVLKQARPAAITLWRDFVLVGDDTRTVCFRQTGAKVWEKGEINRTDVIDGKIYFTDNPDDLVRIGVIDVATGDEHILYTEPK